MRVINNTKLAKRNRQIATYLFLGTMLVLIASFFLVNQSLFTGNTETTLTLLLQGLSLPVAFILTIISVRMTNLWAREPRPENAIEEGLKGLSNKSVLYHYHHIPARHVLICPQGVFAIVTRWHDGHYSVNGNKWKSHQGFFSKALVALRMDGIGNPTLDAQSAAKHLKNQLSGIAPDVEVLPLIVFISPRAEVDIQNPEVPVLYADAKRKPNLKDYMRDVNKNKAGTSSQKTLPLSDEQIRAFEQATIKS